MNDDIRNKDFMPRPELSRRQLASLRATLERVYSQVPFYREAFARAGVTPADLRTLADLSRFPFTTKQDLRDHYPFGLFSAGMSDIVRIHASSGTTGKPTVVSYTRHDLDCWSETVCRALMIYGMTADDLLLNSYGYGLFTGGLGLHGGAERLGCTVVPMGGGATEKQLMLIKDFGVTCISCTPSFFIHLMDEAQKLGFDWRESKLRLGIFGAEPWTEEMRRHIETGSGIAAYDIFGLSEIMGPGVSAECDAHSGLHIFEDHFYPEIIDPDTGAVKAPGEEGELVFTTITKQGMPLIRYRTRDISRLDFATCACGRTMVRMDKVRRRSDDMLIIRGVNLYPSQIESVLLSIKGTVPHYQLVVTRETALDDLEVRVELTPEAFSDEVKMLEGLRHEIKLKIKQLIGLTAKVTLVEPGTIERSVGKAKRVIDLRKK